MPRPRRARSEVRNREDDMPYAHVAFAFQGPSWTSGDSVRPVFPSGCCYSGLDTRAAFFASRQFQSLI